MGARVSPCQCRCRSQSLQTRKIIYRDIPERFTQNTWIQADFCRPAFWETIGDNAFDFIIVSNTLEDVRDPLYLCSQIIRCGKAGYIEVPSKFRECAKITATDSFAGYDHHRSIIEPMPDRTGLIFKAKLSWAHHRDYLGDARRHFLSSYHYHFNSFFWHGSFRYLEHSPKGTVLERTDLMWFYEHFVYVGAPDIIFDLVPNLSHPSDGSCLWVTEYQLPSEASS